MHDPVSAEAVCEKHSFNARSRSDNGVVVRRHLVHTCPATPRVYFDIGKHGNAVYCVSQYLFNKSEIEIGAEAVGLFRVRPRQKKTRALRTKMKPAGHVDNHRQTG